jgi:3-polyprenyl-4-hydroxybenzoate decarboxylase
VWEELSRQLPGVKGVWILEGAGINTGLVISLKQEFAGHAQLAAMTVSGSYAVAYMLKWIIIVDDDIDPTNMHEVMWALGTRGDAAENIHILKGCWGSFIDPSLSPDKRARNQFDHSLAVVLACKPYSWIKDFPVSIKSPLDLMQMTKDKWQGHFEKKNGSRS